MNSYSFSLEKILNLREDKEKEISLNMGKIQLDLKEQKNILKKLEDGLNKGYNNDFQSILELQYENLYRTKVREDINLQNKLIEDTKIQLEETRFELIEAQKDRKIMEKLKEKEKTNYYNELKSKEQKQLDEMAVLKYNYKTLM